jgi:hypothetical protein
MKKKVFLAFTAFFAALLLLQATAGAAAIPSSGSLTDV